MLKIDAPDTAVEAVLDQLCDELARLAATPARTSADLHEKARALATCTQRGRSGPAVIVGDQGLAASLVTDLLALT